MYNHETLESRAVWHALFISVMLHGMVLVWYSRHHHSQPMRLPERLAVELLAVTSKAVPQQEIRREATPVPIVEQSTPKPLPLKQQPVLTDKQMSNTAEHTVVEPISKVTVQTRSEPVMADEKTAVTATENSMRENGETKSLPASASVTVSQESARSVADNEEILSDDDAWQGYGQALHALVSKSKKYPAIAVRRHWEGEARIVARFVRGELVEVLVLEASGHVPLDEEAMRMVKQAIAQLGVRDSLSRKTFKVTIPVSFRLE